MVLFLVLFTYHVATDQKVAHRMKYSRYSVFALNILIVNKKQKDSVEDSLVQVLLTTKLELSKILVPRPPQNVSNVNIEGTRKGKRMYYLCDQLLGAQVYIHFIVLVLICFYLIMRGVNYAINRRLKQEEKYCCGYYSR